VTWVAEVTYSLRRTTPPWWKEIASTIGQLLLLFADLSESDLDGTRWQVVERSTTGTETVVFESRDRYQAERHLSAYVARRG
jgi:hypothetical protein